MNRSLAILRRIVAVAAFAAVTAALISAQLAIPGLAGWIARVQLMSAIMVPALFVFVCWLIVTLVFGRIYCSTVCPTGTLCDIAARFRRPTAAAIARRPYRFTPPANRCRYIILALTLIGLGSGILLVAELMDPYGLWARFCHDCIKPLVAAGAEVPAEVYEEATVRIVAGSAAGAAVALVMTAAVAIAAARRGRIVCNTVCPIGTMLGLISRYSIMQIDIDTDLCTQCRRCVDVCKAECIDITSHTVDSSRCVNCFDCLAACRDDAIHYTARRKQLSEPMMQKVKDMARREGTPVADAAAKPANTENTGS